MGDIDTRIFVRNIYIYIIGKWGVSIKEDNSEEVNLVI